MTLIISGANTQNAFLVADRRFSYENGFFDDERNKAIFFVVRDARLLVAFTGLAQLGQFQTARWLADALTEAAQPELLIEPTLRRFVGIATSRFATIECERRLKRLSIVMSGYWIGENPPRWCGCVISNFERQGGDLQEAADQFEEIRSVEERPFTRESYFVRISGAKVPSVRPNLSEIGELVRQRRPALAIVQKSVHTIRELAESQGYRGSVGAQCNSIYMPRSTMGARAEYHSGTATNVVYMPDSVIMNGTMNLAARGSSIESFSPDGDPVPMTMPRVHRNAPCPCGSGQRFRDCCRRMPWRIS